MKYADSSTLQQNIAETKKFVNSKTRELTQAQYDALTTEEKNNGTTYYITDGEGGSFDPSIYATKAELETKADVSTTYTKDEFNKFTSQGLFPYLFNNITTNFGEFADISITSELGTLTVSNGNLSGDLYNASENSQYVDLFFKKPVEVDTNSYTAILFDYTGSISDDVTVQFIRPNNLLTPEYNIDETGGVCSGILGEAGTGANGEIFKGIRVNIPSNSSFFTNGTPMIFGIYRSYEGLIRHYSNIFHYTTDFSKTETEWIPTNKQLKSYIDDNQTSITNLQTTMSKNGAKNLLPMTLEGIKANNTSGTWSGNAYTYRGVTFTVNTDSNGNVTGISTSGTASGTTYFKITNKDNVDIIAGNTFRGTTDGASNTYEMALTWSKADGSYLTETYQRTGELTNIQPPTNAYMVSVSIIVFASIDMAGKTFYPMIRLATDTDSTFQPYAKTNLELTDDVRAIDYRLEGNACKNLFNINTITVGLINDDGTWNSSQTSWRTSDFIEVKSGVNITFKGLINSTEFNYLSISEYTSNKTFIQRTVLHADTFTLTLKTNTKYVRVGYREEFTNLILSYNPNATYEPYYPSNKELGKWIPKTKTFSGTTTASGFLDIGHNITPIAVRDIKSGNTWYGGTFVTADHITYLHVHDFTLNAQGVASTAITGVLLYYDFEI